MGDVHSCKERRGTLILFKTSVYINSLRLITVKCVRPLGVGSGFGPDVTRSLVGKARKKGIKLHLVLQEGETERKAQLTSKGMKLPQQVECSNAQNESLA